jgi:hypothetical protein
MVIAFIPTPRDIKKRLPLTGKEWFSRSREENSPLSYDVAEYLYPAFPHLGTFFLALQHACFA